MEKTEGRSYMVVKRNDMIQKARHNLDLQGQKILLYLISRVKPNDTDFIMQEFSIMDFCRVCGIDGDNGKNYRDIKKALKKIRDRSIWVTDENGNEFTFAWINDVEIVRRSGTIKVELSKRLKPYLIELQENFTRYELLYTLAMRSQYSIRLYELLKSYQYKKTVTFDFAEFKRLLYAEKYVFVGDIRKRVLVPAVREINELTDITVSCEFETTGKRFSAITFYIAHKPPLDRFVPGHTAQPGGTP